MASTFFGLNIAYTGLQAAQTSINTTAHNISNINTSGYTRQEALSQASDALRTYSSSGTLGSGVTITEIAQKRNDYYDVKYRSNQANYGHYNVKNSYMNQIENYLNEYTLNGYCKEYSNFYDTVKQLKRTPNEPGAKNQLVNSAKSFSDYLNTLSTNLRNIQTDTNNEIKDATEKINTISKNIADLNKQINQIECNFGNANDLRDQRNSLIDDLSQIVNINVYETDAGENTKDLHILIDGQSLVSGQNYNTLNVVARDERRNASDAAGLYDIQWSHGMDFDIYSSTLSGHLKGLIDIRDGCNGGIEEYAKNDDHSYKLDSDGNMTFSTKGQLEDNTTYKGVPYYLSQLNEFAQTFSSAINDLLKSGVTSNGDAGISLFVTSDDAKAMSASSITVNSELLTDSSKLAMKEKVADGESDCQIIEKLYNLESSKIFAGGTGAYFLESIVSDMSIDASKSANMETNYKNLQSTIQNQRLSVMGVDTDEEAMGLMKFQQAYNLNSKILSVMNQIYDKLINQTGV